MAHQVEQMFSVKETPWHKLGHVVQTAPTTLEAMRLAGLDWQVEPQQIYRLDGTISNNPLRIPSHKVLVRSTDKSVLGVVGKDYTPLQNTESFAFFDDFVASGECSFETAGSLKEGKRVWILAKINRDPIDVTGKGDLVKKFLLLSNSHDGSMSVRVGFTPIRPVCANTLAMADNSSQSSLLRVYHTKRVQLNLERIKEIVNTANQEFEATAEQYKILAKAQVAASDIEKYVKIVFNYSDIDTKRRTTAKEEMTSKIVQLFETGRGNDMAGTRGTAWAMYNAVTEYLSYERKGTEEARLSNLWFGHGKDLNFKALITALKLVS